VGVLTIVQDRTEALDNLDFETFKHKVRLAYGMDLDGCKRQQMERRLRSAMMRCGASTFLQYYNVLQSDSALLEEFMDRVTTNMSELFRNPEQFETLGTKILPDLLTRNPNLSIWSAGCCHGAEAYALAILIEELLPPGDHRILATDIDDNMLARAESGVFHEQEMRNVSKSRIAKYFDRHPDGYVAKSALRRWITCRKHNLIEDPFETGFDLILCRNVVVFFTEEAKSALYDRFFQSLCPQGYLFVGGSERITDYAAKGFANPLPFFYNKAQPS